MDLIKEAGWAAVLKEEFEKPYFKMLRAFVENEYSTFQCFPSEKNIFSAFELTPYKKVKVVIIGQDPYHGAGQAHGLCFSVSKDCPLPPSLKNIFKELESDMGVSFPANGNLEHWAEQGVLLLNATLTVREGGPGSHEKKGWETFTGAVLTKLSENREGLVFMLWGTQAKKKEAIIDANKHFILCSGHPSPLSAIRGHWFGNRHFSKANAYLISKNKKPIQWGKGNWNQE